MNDVKGFCKLFDISVPSYDHFDYYIDQLSKIKKYENIKDLVKLYESAEIEYGDLFDLRVRKSNDIIQFLQNTRAYNDLVLDNLIKDYPTSKSFQYEEGKKYISIDINQANWVALKKYDPPFLNELENSYIEFLLKFNIPRVFIHSKSLRQYIFGNINPKRQIKVQRMIIEELLIDIRESEGITIESIKNDEIICSYVDIQCMKNLILKINQDLFKIKINSIKKVEDFRIDLVMDQDENFLYEEMVGCNGNKFFLLLKKYILKEDFDIRDLYFVSDGNLAIWSVDGLVAKI